MPGPVPLIYQITTVREIKRTRLWKKGGSNRREGVAQFAHKMFLSYNCGTFSWPPTIRGGISSKMPPTLRRYNRKLVILNAAEPEMLIDITYFVNYYPSQRYPYLITMFCWLL